MYRAAPTPLSGPRPASPTPAASTLSLDHSPGLPTTQERTTPSSGRSLAPPTQRAPGTLSMAARRGNKTIQASITLFSGFQQGRPIPRAIATALSAKAPAFETQLGLPIPSLGRAPG